MTRPAIPLATPNATQLERAIDHVTARLDQVEVPIRDLWNADACPIEHLPWLAYALSIDAWNADWSERTKRAFVKDAIAVQRQKGTATAVERVVKAFGAQIVVRPWFKQDPPAEPFTFDLVLTVTGESDGSARLVEDVIAEVARTKSARDHFTFTQGFQASGGIAVVGSARVAAYRRLSLREAA
ncbi:Phage tail protein [compost metagenome]